MPDRDQATADGELPAWSLPRRCRGASRAELAGRRDARVGARRRDGHGRACRHRRLRRRGRPSARGRGRSRGRRHRGRGRDRRRGGQRRRRERSRHRLRRHRARAGAGGRARKRPCARAGLDGLGRHPARRPPLGGRGRLRRRQHEPLDAQASVRARSARPRRSSLLRDAPCSCALRTTSRSRAIPGGSRLCSPWGATS